MQVSLETTSGLERRLTVGVPAEQVENEVENRLKQAARNVSIKGFRKGKVPLSVVKQRFGAGTDAAWRLLRERVPAYDQDRWLAPDIAAAAGVLKEPALLRNTLPDLH